MYSSPALASNALHFGSDFGGSLAVLIGLLLVRAGYPRADAVAALLVAVLVLLAAARLMRRNVDVLMDRAPADAEPVSAVRPNFWKNGWPFCPAPSTCPALRFRIWLM